MGRARSNCIVFDRVATLTVSDLKSIGVLPIKDNQTIVNTIWFSNNLKQFKVSVKVTNMANFVRPVLTLTYKIETEEKTYAFKLTSMKSNLNKGRVWFIVCPTTGRRCRKLYFFAGRFLPRGPHGFYSLQILSRSIRSRVKTYLADMNCRIAEDFIYSKYFKAFYKGKPTKKFLKALQMMRTGKLSLVDLERLWLT